MRLTGGLYYIALLHRSGSYPSSHLRAYPLLSAKLSLHYVTVYLPLHHRVTAMFLLIATVFLLKRYGSHAVPLPVPSPTSIVLETPILTREIPSPELHSRTVLDIVWSCLATTFACTWVSVHPNVPFRDEGSWQLRLRRIFLMFFSILAPELMIMWAFKQWRGAVLIKKIINKAFPEMCTCT